MASVLCKGDCGRLLLPARSDHNTQVPYVVRDGKCKRCLMRQWRQNRPATPGRSVVPVDVFLDEYEHFRLFGMSDQKIADRLGMSLDALRLALKRASVGEAA